MSAFGLSPKAKLPPKEPQWPPRSPHEALLASPSGRKKYQRRREDVSPSPSPRRPAPSRMMPASVDGTADDPDVDEEEDEETLQLHLAAIEARLKLKRLQQAKAKKAASTADSAPQVHPTPNPPRPPAFTRPRPRTPEPEIQVPLSPTRRPPKSPARVLLGIDKGLRAKDVSLKRPAGSRPTGVAPSTGVISTAPRNHPWAKPAVPTEKPKSFSERIAEQRASDAAQTARAARVQKARSTGFGLARQADDPFTDSSRAASAQSELSGRGGRARTLARTAGERPGSSSSAASAASMPASSVTSASTATAPTSVGSVPAAPAAAAPGAATDSFDSYSGLHLSRRTISHTDLTRHVHEKELYTLPRLLHEVKAPDYDPPDCENDYIVLGIIASKSTPLNHKSAPKTSSSAPDPDEAKPKFMVLRLTDLKWEIDLFLFDTGFTRFYKLQPGTLIAVLNPGIMPPRDRDTGAFSLKLASCEDTVLEIGTARDLGHCTALKKDSQPCGAWIDARKTTVCEYHIGLQVDKARKGRQALNNSTSFPLTGLTYDRNKGGRGGGRGRGGWRGGGGWEGKGELKREGRHYDSFLNEAMYIAPREYSRSSASLLDGDDTATLDADARAARAATRAREAAREAELAARLGGGAFGGGVGGDYLASRAGRINGGGPTGGGGAGREGREGGGPELPPPKDAASLGLLGKKAVDVSLAPAAGKRKRVVTGGTAEPVGWAGARWRNLAPTGRAGAGAGAAGGVVGTIPDLFAAAAAGGKVGGEKDGEKNASPRKRARFMLAEKGIREPGRESLGAGVVMGDDDDDLEIIGL
ncbi:hypothetical protein EJ06DRAFT_583548 [Trichodelitschia bisporula]|uniref:Uncharacterized protein n=1 Tax=Trichodelitschia bisporula TaxID=703511 RepID=A0A6G1HQY7_9PEZI|nr:hypothetical protein EJ06DRAFT_583548 [Trichodelitschia bisporula]